MAEKNGIAIDNGTDSWIDTTAITRSTTKMHRIRWTVDSVSQLPYDAKIMGPDFYLTKSCLCNISFKKGPSCLFVFLKNKSDKTIKIRSSLVLFDSEGKNLHQENMDGVFALPQNADVDMIGQVKQRSQFDSLKDDILIIDCLLNVEGCITTEKSFFKTGTQLKENLIKDLKKMFNNPTDSDFHLRVGDKTIYTHKVILRTRSAYFKKMFETEMKESAENFALITDVSFPTMLRLIEFLYTGEFIETLEDNIVQPISDMYFAADKYEVLDLRELCSEKLVSNATVDSICEILLLSQRHSDEHLKIRAMDFIYYHFDEVENSNTWKAFVTNEFALASEVLKFCFQRLKSSF